MAKGVELACTEAGPAAAPPLIILHGLFGSARNWGAISKRLAEKRRVLALDLRNHGDSPWDAAMDYRTQAADVAAFIEGRGLAGADIIGHSMGGKVAMMLALTGPRLVGRLLVLDIAPVAYDHGGFVDYVAAMKALPLAGMSRRAEAADMLAQAVPEAGVRGFLAQNLVRAGDGFAWRVNLEAIAGAITDLVDFPVPGKARFAGPSLFLRGGRSDYVESHHETTIRHYFPGAALHTIDGAGHWAHAEKPEDFLAHAEAFFA